MASMHVFMLRENYFIILRIQKNYIFLMWQVTSYCYSHVWARKINYCPSLILNWSCACENGIS